MRTNSSPPSRAIRLANECVTDPLGEHMDELVTGGVAQVVVDGLEAVQVEK